MKKQIAVILILGIWWAVPAVSEANITRVLDSFDKNDPFDADLRIDWTSQWIGAGLYRENGKGDLSTTKIATAKRRIDQLNITARFGLYQDFELDLTFPVIIGDQIKMSPVGNNTTIHANPKDPTSDTLFTFPNSGPKRSGFGDMTVALKYGPLSQERDPLHPSWMVGLEYTIPTGQIRRTNNSAVGLGLHQLKLETAISRRIAFFEPYFGVWGLFRFPSTSSLFKTYGETEQYASPGAIIGMMLGATLYPWRVPGPKDHGDRHFALDLGFRSSYTFQGRDYTLMFETLAKSPQNNSTLFDRQNPKYNPDSSPTVSYLNQLGTTNTGPYGTYIAYVGFDVQPIEYIQIGFRFTFTHISSHPITYAYLGEDLNNSGHIEYGTPNDANNPNEYSPVYNSAIAAPGNRFKVDDYNDYGLLVFLTGKF